jgi:hypothetical protein
MRHGPGSSAPAILVIHPTRERQMSTRTRIVRRAFGAVVFAALTFGGGQAFAGVRMMDEGDECDGSFADLQACRNACIARYGEWAQGQCSRYDEWGTDGLYPTCRCIR